MTLKKKIFGSLFILICLAIAAGIYYFFFYKPNLDEDLKLGLQELPEADLSLSPLEPVEFPEINIEIPLDFSSFKMNLPDLSAEEFIKIEDPKVNVGAGGLGSGINFGGAAPPADWEPDEKTCKKFDLAPSCSFVPEQFRSLCEKCKGR